jgi:hypothetical protein
MKNELPLKSHRPRNRRLEDRLAQRPELLERLHQIVDTLEQSVGDGCDADQTEERVVEEIRKLGQTMLGQWAQEANAQIQGQVSAEYPRACKNGKKNSSSG